MHSNITLDNVLVSIDDNACVFDVKLSEFGKSVSLNHMGSSTDTNSFSRLTQVKNPKKNQ